MNQRTAIFLAAVVLATMLSPVLLSDADAQYSDGIYVELGKDSELSVTLPGGASKDVQLYVTNKTSNRAVISVGVDGLNSDVTYSIGIAGKNDISPAVVEKEGMSVVTITLTARSYADDSVMNATVNLAVTALATSEDGAVEPIEFSFPLTVTVDSAFAAGDSYNKFFGVFPNTLDAPLNNVWVTAVITLVLWTLIAVLVSEIVIPLLTRLVGNRKTKEEKKSLTKQLTASITLVMFVTALQECAMIVGANAEVLHFFSSVSTVVYVVLGAIMAWQIYLFVVTAFLKGLDENADVEGMDMTLLPLFKMIGKLVIAVVALCSAMAAFGVNLASIMVSAGVVSLGITLGAQNTLNQFFSGIVLLATRPFKKGDFVSIGGTTYIVRKVRLMYTEFLNWDKDQIITMPNNNVMGATIVNYTRESPKTRVFVYIDVAYGSDIAVVKKALEDAGKKHPHVIKDGSVSLPGARLTEFADSGIQFRLSCYVDDYDNSGNYAGEIRELVYQELNDVGVEIPYSRIQVDILTEPADNRPASS